MKMNLIRKLQAAGFAELWRDPLNGQLYTREHAANVMHSRQNQKPVEDSAKHAPQLSSFLNMASGLVPPPVSSDLAPNREGIGALVGEVEHAPLCSVCGNPEGEKHLGEYGHMFYRHPVTVGQRDPQQALSKQSLEYQKAATILEELGRSKFAHAQTLVLMNWMAEHSSLSEINDKTGWVYDPGQALANLRRAEAAEKRVAELESEHAPRSQELAAQVWHALEPILSAYGMADWDLTESKRQLFRSTIEAELRSDSPHQVERDK